jgi:hypothetical protein
MTKSRVVIAAALGFAALLIVIAGCSSNKTETETAETVADTATEAAAAPVPEDVFEPVERWQTITLTGVVESIDLGSRELTVTIKGPLGNYLIIDVVDPARLEKLKIGDKALMTYTEALAIRLEKAMGE